MKKDRFFDILYWMAISFQIVICYFVFKQSNWEKLYLLGLLIPSISLWIHEKINLTSTHEFFGLMRKKFRLFRLTMTTMLTFIILIIYLKTFNYIVFDQNILMKYTCGIISIILIIIGNITSNIRPNEYLGVNNFFTRKSLNVWKITNRWTGKLLVFVGLVSLLINTITPANKLIFNYLERIHYIITLVVLWMICPFIYSCLLYNKEKSI